MDLHIRNGKKLEKAVSSNGPAQIVLSQTAPKASTNTINAGQFEARFNDQNRLSSLLGTLGAKIVAATPGKPDTTLTSRELTAMFNDKGELGSAQQTGDFHYHEGARTATAERAQYNAADETATLTGSPRVVDSGLTITADSVELNRKTGIATGQGNVKTTYNDMKAQPNGAMLASGEPVHVTGTTATASRNTGVAHFTAARLWQGGDIIEAPNLTFDKARRSLVARADQNSRVTSVFSPRIKTVGQPQ